MIRHIVLMRTKSDAEPSRIAAIEACLAGLPDRIPGISSFEFGVNGSPEGLDHGFDLGFTMDFVDVPARDAYLPHREHEVCASAIEAAADDVLVFDFEF